MRQRSLTPGTWAEVFECIMNCPTVMPRTVLRAVLRHERSKLTYYTRSKMPVELVKQVRLSVDRLMRLDKALSPGDKFQVKVVAGERVSIWARNEAEEKRGTGGSAPRKKKGSP